MNFLCFLKVTFDGKQNKFKSVLNLDDTKSFYVTCTDPSNIGLSQRVRQVFTLVGRGTHVVIYLLPEVVYLALCFHWEQVSKLWRSVYSIPTSDNTIQGECLAVWHTAIQKRGRPSYQGTVARAISI